MEDADLVCSECRQKYSKGERCPRALFCGHTFCTHCLDQVILRKSRRCPICTRPFIALSATQLPTDFTLLKRASSKTDPGSSFNVSGISSYLSKSLNSDPQKKIPSRTLSSNSSPSELSSSVSSVAAKKPLNSSLSLQTSSSLRSLSATSASQGYKSTISPTTTKSFHLPSIGTTSPTYSILTPRLSSVPATTTTSPSSLPITQETKSSSTSSREVTASLSNNNIYDAKLPRTPTLEKLSSKSQPQGSLTYKLPTIRTKLNIDNQDSEPRRSSSLDSDNVGEGLSEASVMGLHDNLKKTDSCPVSSSESPSAKEQDSITSFKPYTPRDEFLNKKPTDAASSAYKVTSTRLLTGSPQLPLTSRVSKITGQDQRFGDPSAPALPSTKPPPATSKDSVGTTFSLKSLSSLSTSSPHVSSGKKSSRNEGISSSTPSHVLNMCRSITTKSRKLSSGGDTAGVPVTDDPLLHTNTETPEKLFTSSCWTTQPRDPRVVSSPARQNSFITDLTPSKTLLCDDDDKPYDQNKAELDPEMRKTKSFDLQPPDAVHPPITTVEETINTERENYPSLLSLGVEDTSSENLGKSDSVDNHPKIVSSHRKGERVSKMSNEAPKKESSRPAVTDDLETTNMKNRTSSLSPDRPQSGHPSRESGKLEESEIRSPADAPRDVGKLARSSSLSARLSARTSFILKSLKEETDEHSAYSKRPAREGNNVPRNDLKSPDLPSTSFKDRLSSRTSYLSSTDEEKVENPVEVSGSHNSYMKSTNSRIEVQRAKSDTTKPGSDELTRSLQSGTREVPEGRQGLSLSPSREKIMQINRFTTGKSESVHPEGLDIVPNRRDLKPHLPGSPSASSSEKMVSPAAAGGVYTSKQTEVKSNKQSEEGDALHEGTSVTQTRQTCIDKEPSVRQSLSSRFLASKAAKHPDTAPTGRDEQINKNLHQSSDINDEDAVSGTKSAPNTSIYERYSAPSWKPGSAYSRISFKSSQQGKSQRSSGPDAKSPNSQTTEIDKKSNNKSGISSSTYNNRGSTDSSKATSSTSGEHQNPHYPLSPSTRQALAPRPWSGLSVRRLQDVYSRSSESFSGDNTKTVSVTSAETKSPISPLRDAVNFDAQHSTTTGVLGPSGDRYYGTDSIVQEKTEPECKIEKRPTLYSQIIYHDKLAELQIGNVPSVQNEGESEDDATTQPSGETEHSEKIKEFEKDDLDDLVVATIHTDSHHRLTGSDSRLRSCDELVEPQIKIQFSGTAARKRYPRPATKDTVQDIWRARKARQKYSMAATSKQTPKTCDEMPEEAGEAGGSHQLRRVRHWVKDTTSSESPQASLRADSSDLQLNRHRSNLKGTINTTGGSSRAAASSISHDQKKFTQERENESDDDDVGNFVPASTRLFCDPVAGGPVSGDHGAQGQEVQTETHTTTTHGVNVTSDFSQKSDLFQYSGPDSVDAHPIGTTTHNSPRKVKITNLTPLETNLDTLETRPMLPTTEQGSAVINTEPDSGFDTSCTDSVGPSPNENPNNIYLTDPPFISEETVREPFTVTSEGRPGVGCCCSTHGSLLHLYCKSCEMWVCDSCLDLVHQPPPQGRCQVVTAADAVLYMKMVHTEFFSSRVNTLDHFREELKKLLTECDNSIREHDANLNQLKLKVQEEATLMRGIESMRNLALQKLKKVDYWEELLRQNAERISQSSSSQDIVSAVEANRSNILTSIMEDVNPLQFTLSYS
ncbi:mucin-5AC-like [Homarus americanus]|uniref:mucin-5AC-like n=1 Tax=Homarus americanus TaxID=6706 RepID=UPI001C484898|nr:mucin-5AC-like [Homarus americanus]